MLLYLKDYLMVYYINALVSEGLGRPYLMECFEEAKTLVDDAYKYSRDEWVCCCWILFCLNENLILLKMIL